MGKSVRADISVASALYLLVRSNAERLGTSTLGTACREAYDELRRNVIATVEKVGEALGSG